jgi:hypothetical protein
MKMSLQWKDIVQNIMIIGVDDEPILNIQFRLPQNVCNQPATPLQIDSLNRLLNHEFYGVSYSQAKTLLSLRDYGRSCARTMMNEKDSHFNFLSRSLTAYASHYDEIIEFVELWYEKSSKSGSSFSRLKDTPFYADMEEFSRYVIDEIYNGGDFAEG